MPSFEITFDLSNLPNLDDYNIGEHLPQGSPKFNSHHHTLQELSTLGVSENDISLFHMYITFLALHFDERISTLATLKITFDIICFV